MDNTLWKKITEKGVALWLRLSGKWTRFREAMRHKLRVVVIDSDTFKEHLSIELTKTNLFVAVGIGVIVLVVLTTLLIAFTPMREIIPGYVNPKMVEQTYRNAQTIDSLERLVDAQEQMIANIQAVINGEDLSLLNPPVHDTLGESDVAYTHSSADSALRREIEHKQESKSKKKKESP